MMQQWLADSWDSQIQVLTYIYLTNSCTQWMNGILCIGAIPEPYYAQHTQSHNKRFTCNGDESKLADCQRNTINCTNMHSVGVICQGKS